MPEDKLRYPIGKFKWPRELTNELLAEHIADIESFPARIRKETASLSDEQLDTPYREGGWTVRQLVNHCSDSHMNSLIRFKWALTEDKPTIKAYYEDRWAELADSKIPIEPALSLMDGLHDRWVVLLKSLTDEDLNKKYIHPEHGKEIRLDNTIAMYAWHCNHHLAHITELKKREGWL
ncbi:YfiT family bacillithiol transferase [Chondrinema litorale]|uniref:YfiT family bacillithiol transferase n=1 Tax=Chondrinema litorale TaxID=2994555 RepID=UPI002543996D|nr:putative metal-dependent hydrolase [Chondrinema litorale]UZR99352.1 putative metal-dependent hydrolase [Chondrinema litorale]